MNPQVQPRTYRIRLFRDDYERLPDKHFVAVLDFSPGPMLRATEGQLDSLVTSLAYRDGGRGPRALAYHIAIEDEVTREKRCDWPAKTWVED